jgi:peptide/nickel transport system ATP-binding protein
MIPLLKIQALCKTFHVGAFQAGRCIRAVDGVNLEIYHGETLGLVGESGCGKSTLARCAVRLLQPSSGSICFDGTDLCSLSPRALRARRREFQIIFQDASAALDPNMTVREILSEPFEAHRLELEGERDNRIQELLEAVALDASLLHRYPETLSGGQQQRVGIARALALRPKLLIADEPVSSLDASVQAQVLNLLGDLQKRFNLTLILISHSLMAVHYLCTRVAVMYLGRIVEEGTREELFRMPKHPYSALLLQSIPSLNPGIREVKSAPAEELHLLARPQTGCAFHPRCPHVFARCKDQVPELNEYNRNSKVACFLYGNEVHSPR